MQRLLITLGAVFALTACMSPELGSECAGGVAENDCPTGTVCTLARSESVMIPDEPNSERFFCRSICDGASDCPTGFECRRSAGSMQTTCQPDNSTSAADGGV